ncbi:MAG: GspH/FimT family protein [Pseudomonas sp.]|jgi:type IV fimbrial biogenesis protein FimT|uniref:GspH/FimT family protein n=1 Tax=Pseudomonas sp. TaxID=306 RepID=UPI003981C848
MSKQKISGATLTEVIIATSIISIAISIAAPLLIELFKTSQSKALFSEARSAIEYARTIAILNREIIEICGIGNQSTCNSDWSNGWIIKELKTQKPIQIRKLDGSTKIRRSGFTQSIRFYPNGTTPISNGRIYQCNNRKITWQLVINRQGRLKTSPENDNLSQDYRCKDEQA